jgi:hypothetical protein
MALTIYMVTGTKTGTKKPNIAAENPIDSIIGILVASKYHQSKPESTTAAVRTIMMACQSRFLPEKILPIFWKKLEKMPFIYYLVIVSTI